MTVRCASCVCVLVISHIIRERDELQSKLFWIVLLDTSDFHPVPLLTHGSTREFVFASEDFGLGAASSRL